MRRVLPPILCLLIGLGPCPGRTLQVAPDGHDQAAGTADAPLASLTGARDAVRRLREAGVTEAITVEFAGGRYPLPAPVRFTPRDGGTAEAPVEYRAAPGAAPVFDGGERLGPVRVEGDGSWTVSVANADGDGYFEQLYVTGRRATRARTPNRFYHYMVRPVERAIDPLTGEPARVVNRAFEAEPEDLAPLAGLGPDELRDANVVVYHSWESSRHRIAAVQSETSRIFLTGPARWAFFYWRNRVRYVIENVESALDEPGEWFLRRDGTLRYLPLPGEDPATAELVAPRVEAFLRIEGEAQLGLTVEHLTFAGLTFQHAGYSLPPEGHSDGQAEETIGAVVELNGARNVHFRDCEITRIGTYAIWFHEGCRDDSSERCYLHDLGAGGVRLGHGHDNGNPTDLQKTSRIRVDNNIIRHAGLLHHGAIGVWIGHSSDNEVTHNEIADLRYSGVSVGWKWQYGESPAVRNRIEDNHIHHLGWGVLSDMGGIYTLGESPGTVLRGNVIHDIYSYDHTGRGGWGLYNDQASRGIVMENNLVYRTKTGGYHLHFGRDLVIRNNIFLDSMTGQLQHSRQEPHHQYEFSHNIVAFGEGSLFAGNWLDPNLRLRNNLYWRWDGRPPTFGELDFASWLEQGIDQGSVVADPTFVNRAEDDYHLRPDSPALRLGFEPWEYEQAGVYGDPEWVALAEGVDYPPVEFAPDPPPFPPMSFEFDFELERPGETITAERVYLEHKGDRVEVTGEVSASGKQSLRVVDAPGLEHAYNPHFFWTPGHTSGRTRFSFSARPDQGAAFYVQWRDRAQPYRVGPSVTFREGRLFAGQQPLLELPAEAWVRVVMEAGVGPEADGTWSLTVTPEGQPEQRFEDLPTVHADWRELHWLGVVSDATEARVFHLDDLKLEQVTP